MAFKMPKLGGIGAPKLSGPAGPAPKVGAGEGLPGAARPGRVKPILHMASRLHLQGRSAFGPGSSAGSAFSTPNQTPGPDAAFGAGDAPGAAGAAPGDLGG